EDESLRSRHLPVRQRRQAIVAEAPQVGCVAQGALGSAREPVLALQECRRAGIRVRRSGAKKEGDEHRRGGRLARVTSIPENPFHSCLLELDAPEAPRTARRNTAPSSKAALAGTSSAAPGVEPGAVTSQPEEPEESVAGHRGAPFVGSFGSSSF